MSVLRNYRSAHRVRRYSKPLYRIEAMEARQLLSTVLWTGAAGDGQWTTAANWSTGALPTSSDDAVIPAGVSQVTLSSGVQTVNSVNSASPIVAVSPAQLNIGIGGANFSADVTVAGAVIRGGVATFTGASLLGTSAGGTLDGLTLTGNIDLSQNANASMDITGGLNLDGTIFVGSATGTTSGLLSFTGSAPETLNAPTGATAAVVFGAGKSNDIINSTDYIAFGNYTGPGETVTFGSGVDVSGAYGGIIGALNGDQIINMGTISSAVAGGNIGVGAALTNKGSVSVANGATLSLDDVSGKLGMLSAVTNSGTLILGGSYTIDQPVTVDGGSTLKLGGTWQNASIITLSFSTLELSGSFTTAGLGTIDRTGGTINLTGILDNTSAVLDLSAIGAVHLETDVYHSQGIIRGGVIDSPDSVPLLIGDGGTLDGVTVNGNLVGYLTILDDLVLNGTMDVSGQLIFGNNFSSTNPASESITGNATLLLQNVTSNTGFIMNESGTPSAPGTLNLGPNVLIMGSGAIDSSGGPIDNHATIIADVPGKAINIYYAGPITNDGTLQATNGGTLNVSGLTGNLGIASVSGTGSSLILQGTSYTIASDFLVPLGTTLELDGTWQNTAAITIAGGTLNLGGNFTYAGMGVISRPGPGTINLTGILDNTGNTLTFDAATGSWNFDGGGIANGAVVESASAGLIFVANHGGALDGVNFQGDLDLSQVSGASLGIADGLTLDGRILLGNTSGTTYGALYFGGRSSQTLAAASGGSASVLMGASSLNTIQDLPIRAISFTVTFGASVAVSAQGGSIGEITSQPTPFINDGTFALTPGAVFDMQPPLMNAGQLSLANGAILHALSITNTGSITLGASSTVSVQGYLGSFTQTASGTLIDQLGSPPSSAFGQIIATGVATLDGTLEVDWPTGTNPTPGATIPVVTTFSRIGTFATFVTSPSSSTGVLRVQYTPTSAYLIEGGDVITGTTTNDAMTLAADPNGRDIDWTMGEIKGFLPISDPKGLTLNGNGGADSLTLDYSNGDPLPAALHLNGTFTINGLQNLNGSSLDIGKSTVYINYAGAVDPIGWVRAALAIGYNAGKWSGVATPTAGVITTSAGSRTYGIGYADAADGRGVNSRPNTIELKFTVFGDANLDGQVNLADLTALLRNSRGPAAWDNGDFNYDGTVNYLDVQILLKHFKQHGGGDSSLRRLS